MRVLKGLHSEAAEVHSRAVSLKLFKAVVGGDASAALARGGVLAP